MEFFSTPKKSCLTNSPCNGLLHCNNCASCRSVVFGTPKEVRMVALVSSSNKINTTNEGKKFGSYARVNARRNAAVFSKQCQCKLINKNIPVPPTPSSCASLVSGNIVANMNTSNMTEIVFNNNDDGYTYLPFTEMDFYFFGINYGNSNDSIYMTPNYAFGFGEPHTQWYGWLPENPAILFDFFDVYNFNSYVSSPQNGTIPGVKYVRIVFNGTDYVSYSQGGEGEEGPAGDNTTIKKAYEIYYIRDSCFQYMQFNCFIQDSVGFDRSQYNSSEGGIANISNITNGTSFLDTFGAFGNNPSNTEGPQAGESYVIKSDLTGNNWQFFPNMHLIF